jgi:hypothetical protein
MAPRSGNGYCRTQQIPASEACGSAACEVSALASRFQFDQLWEFQGEAVSPFDLPSPVGAGDSSSSDACSLGRARWREVCCSTLRFCAGYGNTARWLDLNVPPVYVPVCFSTAPRLPLPALAGNVAVTVAHPPLAARVPGLSGRGEPVAVPRDAAVSCTLAAGTVPLFVTVIVAWSPPVTAARVAVVLITTVGA